MIKIAIIVMLILVLVLLYLYYFIPYNSKIFNLTAWDSKKEIIDYKLDGTSKKIFDIYSFSHITHGILFYIIFKYLGFSNRIIFILSLFTEIIWEIFENTEYIINKYRKKFKNYKGDSIVNIIGDIIFTIIGIIIAHYSIKAAIIYVIISEIVLYFFNASLLYLSIGGLIL